MCARAHARARARVCTADCMGTIMSVETDKQAEVKLEDGTVVPNPTARQQLVRVGARAHAHAHAHACTRFSERAEGRRVLREAG